MRIQPSRLLRNLTVQVLLCITAGVLVGLIRPDWGVSLKPLGDGFVKLVKMVVGPIIFLTVSAGIAGMGDLRKVGRVGGKALLYFEAVTTLALAIGLIVANLAKPGAGIHPPAAAGAGAGAAGGVGGRVAVYAEQAAHKGTVDFLLNVIPDSVTGAFASGDILQILFFSVLFGLALAMIGPRAKPITSGLELLTEVMFRIVALVMRAAPIGAFGAMAYTIGKFGGGSLVSLGKLMLCVYLTMALFIVGVLGTICRLAGFSLLRFLGHIREEIFLVLGTSSSESALPRLIQKMEQLGCSKTTVGLVIPAGYSFNLDGTSIYLSMAALFIAQAYGIPLSMTQQLSLMAILMLTSKGAAGVTGSGFVTLAATLSATHLLPVEGVALLLGVDRFMSEARAITNLIGNGVATLVVSRWEGEAVSFDLAAANSGEADASLGTEGLVPARTDLLGSPLT